MKRFLSLFVAAFVLVTSIPRAAAADVTGTMLVVSARINGGSTSSAAYVKTLSNYPNTAFPISNNTNVLSAATVNQYNPCIFLEQIQIPASKRLGLDGTIGIYFTYFMASNYASPYYIGFTYPNYSSGNTTPVLSGVADENTFLSQQKNKDEWSMVYYDQNSSTKPFPASSIRFSDVVAPSVGSSYTSYSRAISCRINYNLPADDTLSGFQIGHDLMSRHTSIPAYYFGAYYTYTSGGTGPRIGLFMPSFSIVATETPADLVALEGIADAITQQNAILSSYYGDIVSLLNRLYSRLGDLETAANLANTYLQSIVSHITSLDSTVNNIHGLISTYLHFLQDIASSAASIDTELKQFHTDFIDRLDQIIAAINSESPDISDPTDGAQGAIDNFEQLEQGYISSMTDSFNSIDFGTTFDGGFVDGLTLYTNLFMEFWDALGVYAILYTIPLVLGLMLLIVGRVSPVVSPSGGSEGPPSRDSDTGLDVRK